MYIKSGMKLMFKDRLVFLRKSRKLTQSELAKRMNVSRGQIANYELGRAQPDFDILVNLADFFAVTTDFLLGREDITQSKKMLDFNNRLLNEIVHLRKLESIVGTTQRISIALEMLRFVRNTELGLNFEEGLEQEDKRIAEDKRS